MINTGYDNKIDLNTDIYFLEEHLSTRTRNALRRGGYSAFNSLIGARKKDLLKIANFGKGCLEEVVIMMEKNGYPLG